MTTQPEVKTPIQDNKEAIVTEPSRIGKLKLAFLYVLIGGLVTAALVAIISLLIGEFNSGIQKSLSTIFVFFSHSLLILALLWADRDNEVGRSVLPTTIFALTLANMITTTLATWEIISSETAWRALGLYFLVIGAVFVITGLLKLRIKHQTTQAGLFVTILTVSALIVALSPWVLDIVPEFNSLYFRIVAALSILTTTVFIITVILRGIALARNTELKSTAPVSKTIPGGLLAIYITVGTIAAMVWCTGFVGFLVSAVDSGRPSYTPYSNSRYN